MGARMPERSGIGEAELSKDVTEGMVEGGEVEMGATATGLRFRDEKGEQDEEREGCGKKDRGGKGQVSEKC